METNNKSLTPDEIEAMCKRGLGNKVKVESTHELSGGTFNTSYIITLIDHSKVILRVAPPRDADVLWDEVLLMQREHSMQPYFAPIANLMPKTLLVDFTHQLIDRDYIFQSFIEGERWDNAVDELHTAESNALWTQFGEIANRIHVVSGEKFGLPLPGYQFDTWSQTVIDRFERALQAARGKQIEIPYLTSILEIVRAHPHQLDEIQVPRLLHGDLWLFNILIRRDKNGPTIAGILDADRSWWGDPMADWTMFILKHAEKEAGHSHFWKAYGQLEDTLGHKFRTTVYDAMHASTAYIWASQHQDEETVKRATGTLGEVAAALVRLS